MLPLLVLVLVPADLHGGPFAGALERALSQTLGARATVELRSYADAPPGAEQLGAAARDARAAAVAVLVVGRAPTERVTVRMRVTGQERTVVRVMEFEARDPPAERGRALGLVIAALLPEPSAPPPPAPAPPVAVASAPAPATSPAATYALSAAGTAGVGIDGYGPGAGVDIALARRFGRLALRAGLMIRAGEVAPAKASSIGGDLGVGLRGSLLTAGADDQVELGVRADVRLGFQRLSHFSDDDPAPVHQAEVAPLGDGLIELRWRFLRSLSLLGAAGAELPFARRTVTLRGERVASLATVVGVVEIGVETSF